MLVERDPHVRELADTFLVEAGFRVERCGDAHEAVSKLHLPDLALVITEILLPKLDGLSLCRRIKANPDTTALPVLILSILAAGARAKEAGADGFLLKPLVKHRLIAMVQDLVEQRSPVTQQHVVG